MKNHIKLFSMLSLAVLLMSACSKEPAEQAPQAEAQPAAQSAAQQPAAPAQAAQPKKFYGIYEGVLPAADCPGIKTSLLIRSDGRFTKLSEYLGRTTKAVDSGTFTVENGVLKTTDKTGEVFYYLIGDQTLQQLDMQGNPIEGALAQQYILKRRSSR